MNRIVINDKQNQEEIFPDNLSYFPDEGEPIEFISLSRKMYEYYVKPKLFDECFINKYGTNM